MAGWTGLALSALTSRRSRSTAWNASSSTAHAALKDLGLSVRDSSGELLRIDDERLAPLFEKAAELHIPVIFHTSDPDAFFAPINRFNERFKNYCTNSQKPQRSDTAQCDGAAK